WMTHDDFLDFLRGMDLSLQVSFSETFDIVMADSVAIGLPSVGSDAIRWLSYRSKAGTNWIDSIVATMSFVLNSHQIARENLRGLTDDAAESRRQWLSVMETIC